MTAKGNRLLVPNRSRISRPGRRWLARGGAAIFATAMALARLRAGAETAYVNPVMAGDHPDPSVIRVGRDYWAVATSGEWGPQFPLLHSTDLVNWETAGVVFPHRPDWAGGSFWAPEISEWRGRYFVYYTARMLGGPLAVAVAAAESPQGPYLDYGTLVAQDAGSIDPMPVTDAQGGRWLVWKEDGNSRREPTRIWLQPLDQDGVKLVGRRQEILRNDAPWEGAVVEAPFILLRGGYYYLFYSGNGCCGQECAYAMGVARCRSLVGPWEKNPRNPILAGTERWRCPGHGSLVTDARGRIWLLYHAYDPTTWEVAGRQMLLDEVRFGEDGWPTIHEGKGPSASYPAPFGGLQKGESRRYQDRFHGGGLDWGWRWPQGNEPGVDLLSGALVLTPLPAMGLKPDKNRPVDPLAALIARPALIGGCVSEAQLDLRHREAGWLAGLAVVTGATNGIGIGIADKTAKVWRRQGDRLEELDQQPLVGARARFRVVLDAANRIRFAVSGNGRSWTELRPVGQAAYPSPGGGRLWIGLNAGGGPARFTEFSMDAPGR